MEATSADTSFSRGADKEGNNARQRNEGKQDKGGQKKKEINTSTNKHVTSSCIDKSEVDALRKLNKDHRKTIAFLKRKLKDMSSILGEEDKNNRAEEIEALEKKNKSLNLSLTKEKKSRLQAETKLWKLRREQEELKLKIESLEKKISRKEETISILKEINAMDLNPPADESESDPESDNEEDDQGPNDSDGHDDSDEDFSDGQMD